MKPSTWLVALVATLATASIGDDLKEADALFAREGPTANVLHKYDRVVRDMERDTAVDDTTKSAVYFKRGLIAHLLQKDPVAIADFQKVVQLDPTHTQASQRLNELYVEQGLWDDVVGLDDARNEWNQLYELAKLAMADGEYGNALQFLTPVTTTSPNHVELHRLRYQAAKKLFEQDKTAVVADEPVSRIVTDSLAHLLKISPNDIDNYLEFAIHMLFNQVEVQALKNTARACLRINNEFAECGQLSKLHNKFGDLFAALEDYLILMGHYYSVDSQHEVEEPKFDWSMIHNVLFVEPVRKVNRRDQGKWKNNYEYLEWVATNNYNGANSQFLTDLRRMACEAMIQKGDFLGAQKLCGTVNGPFLPRDIPQIDKLIKNKQFQDAKRILDQYALSNVGELQLFNDRYQKIDEWMRQRQRERQRQQQQHQQQYQQQYRQQHQQQQRAPPRARSPPKHDYYKILDVDKDADERTIRKAYRTQTLKYHPDKSKSLGLTPEEAEAKMQEVNKAYEVLSDKELRERYDLGEDPNDPESQGGGGGGYPGGFQGGNPFGGGGGVNFENIFQQFFQQQRQQQQRQQQQQRGGGPKVRKKKKSKGKA